MNVNTSAHFTWCIQIGISWLSMANNRNTNCSGWCKVWYVYSWICQGGFRIVFAILFLAFFSAGITHWHLINQDVLTNTCKQFLSWRMPINMPISCPIYPHPLLKKINYFPMQKLCVKWITDGGIYFVNEWTLRERVGFLFTLWEGRQLLALHKLQSVSNEGDLHCKVQKYDNDPLELFFVNIWSDDPLELFSVNIWSDDPLELVSVNI